MTKCNKPVRDQDGEVICTCGDEGLQCDDCMDAAYNFWRALYDATPLAERDPDAYREQMKEAGRGHLLPPED